MRVENTSGPLVSLILIAYKQEKFIREAVSGALAQTYSPLQIVLCDDCSPDRTYEIMQEMVGAYHGPHQVVLNRNPVNLGAADNLNRGWQLSQGEFIVVQAGDDISLPHRTERLVSRWRDRSRPVDLVCSHYAVIGEDGSLTGRVNQNVMFVPDRNQPVERWRCGAAGSCAAYSRRLYEKYGPLDRRVIAEDWVFSFRAWVESGLDVVPEPLVYHRKHPGGISVQARRFTEIPSRQKRYAFRKRMASGALAIAEEWLRAWRVGRWRDDTATERALERLVALRKAQFEAFEASPANVLRCAWKILTLGSVRHAGGVVVRHGLGVH